MEKIAYFGIFVILWLAYNLLVHFKVYTSTNIFKSELHLKVFKQIPLIRVLFQQRDDISLADIVILFFVYSNMHLSTDVIHLKCGFAGVLTFCYSGSFNDLNVPLP